MADFSKIDEQVNAALSTQSPEAPPSGGPPAPTAPAPEPTPLEVANARIAALEADRATERAKHEEAVRNLRLDKAVAITRKPIQDAGIAQQDMAFDELQRKVGGNCHYHVLTPAQKLEGIGVFGSEQIKDSTVKIYFGAGSDAAKANALRRSDPAMYARLRAIAKARNLY